MADDANSAFTPSITEIQHPHHQQPPPLQLQEQEQFAAVCSVTAQESVESSDIPSSTPKQEDPLVMETGLSFFKKVTGSHGETECENINNFTAGNQELNQELFGSMNEEVTACDLVSGSSECERKMVGSERKVDPFGVETENGEVGCVAEVEETMKDSVNLEVGCSGIGESNKFNEEKCVVEIETSSVMENNNVMEKEIQTEALLEAKKKRLLAALEGSGVASFSHVDEKRRQEVHKLVQSDGETIDGIRVVSARPSLKIEVIDDTALIESVRIPKNGNACEKEIGTVGASKMMKRSRRQGGKEQEAEGKNARLSRRKRKEAKKVSEMSEGLKNMIDNVDDLVGGLKNGKQEKIMYTRKEMEALRFVNIVEQRKMWRDIYTGLEPVVMNEYDGLASSKHQKQFLNFDSRQQFPRKPEAPGIIGEEQSQNVDNESEYREDYEVNLDTLGPGCGHSAEGDFSFQQGEYSEDYDSDEDYASIQRPAFLVEGEPDFDSGPPEDGLEYLRRVRWEAAHIPKVKVANLDGSIDFKEQSVYMPQIPGIAPCPEHLMPLKQWEDSFLADFSKLRQVLSGIENSSVQVAAKLQEMVIFHKENESGELTESVIAEKFDNVTSSEVNSCQPFDSFSHESAIDQPSVPKTDDDEISPLHQSPRTSLSNDSDNYPTLSAILRMDSVARVSMLRKRINSVENLSTLSRNDGVWLFALCAAVDTPVDADTSAALRSLLRKCASLRAGKSELDDEVVMLNILATISGRYFGQAED